MKRLPLFILLLLVVLPGCASRYQYMAFPPEDTSKLTSQQLLAFAYDHYSLGDHVRALRFVYRAAAADPDDLRSSLLMGLIYDLGFDRPDLAIPEYERVLPLRPWSDLPKRLENRLYHLRQRSEYNRLSNLVKSGNNLPDSTYPLAVLQFESTGPRAPSPGISLGLMDMILHGLSTLSDPPSTNALDLHILQRAYLDNAEERSNPHFASWSGAEIVLTGTLTDLGKGRLQIVVLSLGPDGSPIYRSSPITGNTKKLSLLYRDLMQEVANALNLPLHESGPNSPISNTLSLLIHTRALELYLSGQSESASLFLSQALDADPGSDLIGRTLAWVEGDLAGKKAEHALVSAYKKIMENSVTLAGKR
jgi:tetratricopeptide (TPR) repeat protein